jgi:hypothetical protein
MNAFSDDDVAFALQQRQLWDDLGPFTFRHTVDRPRATKRCKVGRLFWAPVLRPNNRGSLVAGAKKLEADALPY